MEEPKYERYAIFQTGGKQYQAIEGRTLAIEKLENADGEKVTFGEVLLRKTGEGIVQVGQPFLVTPVIGEIVKQTKGPKVTIRKFKRRKDYRVTQGHRQPLTVVRIISI